MPAFEISSLDELASSLTKRFAETAALTSPSADKEETKKTEDGKAAMKTDAVEQQWRRLADCRDLLAAYNGTDYLHYVSYKHDAYHKIKLPQSTAEFDIYLICWLRNQQTRIHDHPSGGCMMKVLLGELTEFAGYECVPKPTTLLESRALESMLKTFGADLRDPADVAKVEASSAVKLPRVGSHHCQQNLQQGLVSFRKGPELHCIKNREARTVSLHVYAPSSYQPTYYL